MQKKQPGWKQIFYKMRVHIIAFLALVLIAGIGFQMFRVELLKNAQSLGSSLSRNYASEERNNLTVYETLISIGVASIDQRVRDGEPRQEMIQWMQVYFERIEAVLGEGKVDPYIVLDGEIIALNPWEGDESYDFQETQWYQEASAAEGEVIFTNVYTDAIYQEPVITAAQKCEIADAIIAFDIFPRNFHVQENPGDLSEGDSFFLCDSTGELIYSQTELSGIRGELQNYVDDLIKEIKAGNLDSYNAYIEDLDGGHRAVYYSRMSNGWFSIITIPYQNILGNWNKLILILGAVFLLFLLVIIWMSWREWRLNARMERTNETVRVLGNSYYALYRIDFGQKTYEMIKGSDYVRSRLEQKGNYQDLLKVMGEVIEESAYEEYMESFSLENIRRLVSQRIRDFGGDFLRKFGEEYRWVSVRVLFDESLAPEEVVLCFRQVEEEKQRQLRERSLLENALKASRESEEAKQTFFSNMSHDMRTPLNAIIGLSELIPQHLREPEKIAGYTEKINLSSRQLLALINDILDMSRIEQGKMTLSNQQFHLKKCVEDCLETFRIQAQKEGKTFSLSFDLKDEEVIGDPLRISQILNNLLSNALKFTEEGDEVSVSVMQTEGGEYAKYKFVVQDTGIGMTEDFLKDLFEPYAREMRFHAKEVSGTGLGMPIVKNLVSQMNGEIYVASSPDQGSTFTIILPLMTVAGDENKELSGEAADSGQFSIEGKKLLLAEDNAVNMEIATELLSADGADITQAWNGEEAVEAFKTSEPFAFDGILMDMQMPVMDGCEAVKQIRALKRPDAQSIPIIAVTANAFAEDIAATEDAGMNAHISKPIDFPLLYKTLEKLLKNAD